LLDAFSRYATNAPPFLADISALIDRDVTVDFQDTDAKAAWRILHTTEPARTLIKRLGAAAFAPEATPEQVNRFAAAALNLGEVPGINEVSKPMLKRLGNYTDDSAARFASKILAKLDHKVE
jgi:hypothetical protein